MAKFLSDEWIEAANSAATTNPSFTSAAAGKDLGVQFVVTDVPDGDDVEYFLSIKGGHPQIAKGALEDADVTVTSTYENASAIAQNDINVQMAFMTGKVKVAGNLATLMLHQNVIAAWVGLSEGMETVY
jgi:putative sterol carrier protein